MNVIGYFLSFFLFGVSLILIYENYFAIKVTKAALNVVKDEIKDKSTKVDCPKHDVKLVSREPEEPVFIADQFTHYRDHCTLAYLVAVLTWILNAVEQKEDDIADKDNMRKQINSGKISIRSLCVEINKILLMEPSQVENYSMSFKKKVAMNYILVAEYYNGCQCFISRAPKEIDNMVKLIDTLYVMVMKFDDVKADPFAIGEINTWLKTLTEKSGLCVTCPHNSNGSGILVEITGAYKQLGHDEEVYADSVYGTIPHGSVLEKRTFGSNVFTYSDDKEIEATLSNNKKVVLSKGCKVTFNHHTVSTDEDDRVNLSCNIQTYTV